MALDFPPGTTGATYTGPGGVIWVYDGTKWVSGTLTTGIYAPITNDNGRNLVHNSMMAIAQRGTGSWTTAVYTVDRWTVGGISSDTFSFSQTPISDANRLQIGDEAAEFQLVNTNFVGNAAAGSYHYLTQKIENVRRLAGKTVTVSFYALASAALKFGVSFYQDFGTGGSPSALATIPGQAVTLATTWARYSLTFTLPVISSIKTVGTNGNSCTWLNLWYSCGTTNAALSGSVGVQSGTVQLWGVQLEVGTVATPLEKLDPVTQLQQCQRFFCTGSVNLSAYSSSGGFVTQMISLPVPMRGPIQVTPSLTPTNVSGPSMDTFPPYQVRALGPVTATGACSIVGTFTASSDL